MEGTQAESIFLVQSGCVRLVVFPDEGKQLVLYRARSGEAFAEEHLSFDQYSYRAIADEPTDLQVIPKGAILKEIYGDPVVAQKFINCLCGRYYQLRINFERLGIKSAKARVLHLLKTMQHLRPVLDLTGKIKSLSQDLNLSHEATYRALRELEDSGQIRRDNGQIEICEP